MDPKLIPLCFALGCAVEKAKDPSSTVDADSDGWAADEDCEDGSSAIHPEAPELCDSLDNDCDGEVDEDPAGVALTYPDADGDGWGDAAAGEASCDPPEAWISAGEDCDDADPTVYPGAPETCDALDDDCDGLVDESAEDSTEGFSDADGDGWGDAESPTPGCEIGQSATSNADDCDDSNGSVHPGATQVCGPVDNDCDPSTVGDTGVSVMDADGTITDRTEDFAEGTETNPVELTLDGGDWQICDGTWNVHLTLAGMVSLTGSARLSAVLEGAYSGPVVTIASEGAAVTLRSLTLTGGLGIMESSSGYGGGGGLACTGNATVEATDITFHSNTGETGGGIYVHGCSVSLSEAVFYNNTARWGGGIFLDKGQLVLDGSEMLGNAATGAGGAIDAEATSGNVTVSLTNTLIHDNSAVYGGAVAVLYDAQMSCTGSSEIEAGIVSNYAEIAGGVYIAQRDGTARFTASACDFGEEDDANVPNDVGIGYSTEYLGFGQDASFECDEESCG